MTKRLCLSCNQPTDGSRCNTPQCKGGSRQNRGYGAEYQRARRQCLQEETVCWLCGKAPTHKDPLTADHVIPYSDGGTHDRSNLRAAHRSCNSRRGRGGENFGADVR